MDGLGGLELVWIGVGSCWFCESFCFGDGLDERFHGLGFVSRRVMSMGPPPVS